MYYEYYVYGLISLGARTTGQEIHSDSSENIK